MASKRTLLVTVPGLEKYLVKELEMHGYGAEVLKAGRVVSEIHPGTARRVLGCCERVSAIVATAELESRRSFRKVIRGLLRDFGKDLITSNATVSVVVRVEGVEDTSLELVASREVSRVFKGVVTVPRVGDVELRFEVFGNTLYFCVDATGERSLHRRPYYVYKHPAAINPVVATAMNIALGAPPGSTVTDPFCGGGTIAIEGALRMRYRYVCVDWREDYIRGALENARNAGVECMIHFIVADSRTPCIDPKYIVTNPPFGGRMRGYLKPLYRSFANMLKSTESAAVITPAAGELRKILEKAGLKPETELLLGGERRLIMVKREV